MMNFLIKLITLVIFILAGMKIGTAVAQLLISDQFVQWHLLDSQQKFRHITYANQNEVDAQTENGQSFTYQTDICADTGRICKQWIESKPYVEFDPGTQSIISSGCSHSYQYYNDFDPIEGVKPRYPPQFAAHPLECVVSKERNPYNGEATLTYYVLLDNGKIWKWRHKPSVMGGFAMEISGILIGLLIGARGWYLFQKSLN